jgi:putative transposase
VLHPPVEPGQFTSWVFGEKIRSAGLLPSFGTVGDGLDNAMMESFWSSMQIQRLNRKKWKTRVELANAISEYIEIFQNRRRRHSALGYRTPIEYELLSENDSRVDLPVQFADLIDDGGIAHQGRQPRW